MSSVAVLLPASEGAVKTTAAADRRDRILRFQRSERLVHWALAIPFMVCYTTALILVVVYNPNPTRPLRLLVSTTHRVSGLCLFILPLWTLFRHRHDAHLHVHNVRQVWRWTRDDVRWLCLIGAASVCRRISLPHQGKFNAGEKINFMSVSSTYSIYIVTGVCIWAGVAPYLSWLVHFSLAACATPLLFGHIFMAIVNPDTRPGLTGMISGFVDREWASHHYHHWYQEHFGKAHSRATTTASAPAPVCAADVRMARTAAGRTSDDLLASTPDRGQQPHAHAPAVAASETASAPAAISPALGARPGVAKAAAHRGACRLVDGLVPDASLGL